MAVTPDEPAATPSGLDLSPRDVPTRRRRRWPAYLVIGLIVVGIGFVATRALTDATLFFYNADEAVERRDQLGTDRFRLQGTVEDGTISEIPNGVEFAVVFNGVEVHVAHQGDPPELFQAGMPVVLEGRWDPTATTTGGQPVFSSDRMLVKHDEQYDAENPERIQEADEGGQVGPSSVAP
jgi:cytochrome c-type biogenesis protein CcmE